MEVKDHTDSQRNIGGRFSSISQNKLFDELDFCNFALMCENSTIWKGEMPYFAYHHCRCQELPEELRLLLNILWSFGIHP